MSDIFFLALLTSKTVKGHTSSIANSKIRLIRFPAVIKELDPLALFSRQKVTSLFGL